MKICFFSDIHGNNTAFLKFLSCIENEGIDLMVCGGDVSGYYYESEKVISVLRKTNNLHCTLGNHDKLLLDALDGIVQEKDLINKYGNSYLDVKDTVSQESALWLRSLETCYRICIDGINIGFFHGGPDDHLNQRIYPDTEVQMIDNIDQFNIVFCGHTHHKMILHNMNCIYINPGAIGQPRDGQGVSYIIFDTDKKNLDFCIFHYDRGKVADQVMIHENRRCMKDKLIEGIMRERSPFCPREPEIDGIRINVMVKEE